MKNSGVASKSLPRRTVLGAALGTACRRAVSGPPNILFIMADDLGYADLGCYGQRGIATPNIDRLAARGVRLLQSYANAPVCSATRTALMTGRYQYRLPVGLEEPLTGGRDTGLPPEHPTLPSLLKKAGYKTALIGKWHLGQLPKYGPLQSGYDHFWGVRGGAVDYFTHAYVKPDLWDGDRPIQQAGYLTDLLGDRAVETINRFAKSGGPFLLSLHFTAPHWPWEAPGDEAESERLRATNDPERILHFDGGSQQTYRRMIERMDLQVGRVVEALTANGLIDNTIVIFTSDNGGERFSDTGPFTGIKQELLEGGLRVPAIVSWPARLPQGRTTDQVAITMDWLPTLLVATGVSPDPAYPPDGINLLPSLSGNTPPAPRKLYWRYKAHAQRAARDGDFKFLKIRENTFLFYLGEDPMERANLKDRRKDVYNRITADWHAWNGAMLPQIDDSYTDAHIGSQFADHIGDLPSDGKADNPAR